MAARRKFKLALVQMTCAPEPDENLKKAISRTRESARAGASIVCLPELFRSQYFCQGEDAALFDLAEPVPGPTTDALTKVARETGVAVIAPVFERRAPGLYHNSVAGFLSDGGPPGLPPQKPHPDRPALHR